MAVFARELAGLGLADAPHQGLAERFGMAGVTGHADLLADEMRFNRRTAGLAWAGLATGATGSGFPLPRRKFCNASTALSASASCRRGPCETTCLAPTRWANSASSAKDRLVLRGRRDLLAGCLVARRLRFRRLRFHGDRLGEAGERGERIVVAPGRRGLGAVEIEQRGINALPR